MRENNQNIDLSNILGKSIDADMLNTLITEGRIQFPTRPVSSPSAVSKGASNDACETDPIPQTGNNNSILNDIVASVKNNEELIKTLEDMRDDLLKGMKIPPANNTIAAAAKKLGSKDGIITKDIFNRAETIMDPDFQAIANWGYVPKLMALLGDGRVFGSYINCEDVTRAVFDGFNLAKGTISTTAEGYTEETINDTIAKTEESFALKMKEMFHYLFNKLFWNYIWCRIWVAIFDLLEKMIAVPIDTPIIILSSLFKFPKLTKTIYYQRGPIHKLINKAKISFLCRIPKRAWSEYEAPDDVTIYFRKSPSDQGGMISVAGICTSDFANANPDCVEQYNKEFMPLDEDGNIKPGPGTPDEDKENLGPDMASIFAAMSPDEKEFNTTDCYKTNPGYDNTPKGTDTGVSPDCKDAAKTVLLAVYNDAKFNTKV